MIITSAANPLVKRIRKLRDRKHRRAEGAFFVEGVQPVWRAHSAGADIETLVVAPELIAGSPAEALVGEFERGGGEVARLSAEAFAAISDRDGPAGVAAIVRQTASTIADLAVTSTSVFVGLYEIANPGNLGTIIRTADSFGVAGVLLIGETADPFAPAAVKASMGSLFALPVVPVATLDDAIGWAHAAGVSVVTTSARGSTVLGAAPLRVPALFVFGSEGDGLPADVIERGDIDVRIPMVGTASSLNLAVAAGIVLYLATA